MRLPLRIVLGTLLFFALPPPLHALEVPEKPAGYVHDAAGLLQPATRSKLEAVLRGFESQTTNQIVVATFPSLEGEALEDFSIRVAESWKAGRRGRDNGVLFLIFRDDRKMRIEVGYGLEGVLPDALAGQIISQVVAPQFQKGDYETGILAGVAAIMRATRGEFTAAASRTGRSPYGNGRRELTPEEMKALQAQGRAVGMVILILVILFFIIDFFRYRTYRHQHRLYRDRYSFWEWWFRFAILLAVLSILFRILFYMMLFSRGGYYGGRGGFGGFRGGGGSFGGGGASGGW